MAAEQICRRLERLHIACAYVPHGEFFIEQGSVKLTYYGEGKWTLGRTDGRGKVARFQSWSTSCIVEQVQRFLDKSSESNPKHAPST